MSHALPWIASALLAAAAVGPATNAAAPADAPDAVDRFVETGLADGSIAGAAVARIDAGGVSTQGHGRRTLPDGAPPTGDTQFQLGSITKVFTNLLRAELVEAGVVADDTTLGALLGEGFDPRNDAVAAITLASLSTHTSGLPRLPSNLPLDDPDPYAKYAARDLVAGLERAREAQPLGHFYSYSNFGAGVLGYALGIADGGGYRKALATRVLAPLGLQRTGFEPGDDAASAVSGGKAVPHWRFDALAAAGALWGSAGDLGRLVQVFLGDAKASLRHDLARDLAVVERPHGAFDLTRVWHVAYAGEHPFYWHNGGTAGFHSFVGFRPDARRGVAILVSGDADPTAAGLDALGRTPREPRRAPVDASLAGQYRLTPAFGLGVHEVDGVLVVQATGQPAFALHAVRDDWYALGEVDASVRFVREDGRVVAAELAQNGIVQRAGRVAGTADVAARREIALDAATLDGYVGAYAFAPGVALTVRRRDAGLEAQLTGQPFFPVFPRAADRFFYKVVDAELAFERDDEGKVEAVVLHQGGVEQRAKRTR